MVRLNFNEIKSALNRLEAEGSTGHIAISVDRTKIILQAQNKIGQEVEICLHDVDYPMKPTIKKVDTL